MKDSVGTETRHKQTIKKDKIFFISQINKLNGAALQSLDHQTVTYKDESPTYLRLLIFQL